MSQRLMTPGDCIAARERLGLSLSEIARALPCDRMTWWRYEQGRRLPPPYLWRAIRDLERELKKRRE